MSSLQDFVNDLKDEVFKVMPMPKAGRVVERPADQLYNIHKRSMPIATDKVVLIGLKREDADKELLKLLRRENKRRNEMSPREDMQVFYYFDVVPQDCTAEEKSIYYNEGSVLV